MNKKGKQYIFSMVTAALLIALKIILERFLIEKELIYLKILIVRNGTA